MGVMLSQLDIHDTRSDSVDIFIKDVPFEPEVRVGIEELINWFYIMIDTAESTLFVPA